MFVSTMKRRIPKNKIMLKKKTYIVENKEKNNNLN